MTEQELNQRVEEQTQEVAAQDLQRYTLVEIVEKRDEIRQISEATIKSIQADYSDLAIPMWELVPIVSMEFMRCMIDYLATRKTTKVESIEIEVGQSFVMGVEYTAGLGEKDGSFNPFIQIGEELKLDGNPNPITNIACDAKWVVPTIQNNIDEIKEISFDTLAAIARKHQIKNSNVWGLPSVVTIYFLREMKAYLDAHKDEFDLLEIPVGNTFTMGVEKVLGDDDQPEFYTYITPGQEIKLATKDDKQTELE